MTFQSWLAQQHPNIPAPSAAAVLKLADGGATVPFIARYRKEETGNLDEVAIRQVIEGKDSWDEILKRQAFIVSQIESQGKLTPALEAQLRATFDLALLEDLYLPFKQKRKTKAAIAREAGLEPLAIWLWDCGHGAAKAEPGETPEARAQPFCDADRGSPTAPPRWRARGRSSSNAWPRTRPCARRFARRSSTRAACARARPRKRNRTAASKTISPIRRRSPSC
jgi:transcriptional accessory protein Tex/SPT6